MMENYQDELARIKGLLKKSPEGMSVTEIAKALNKNKNTVGRYLDILLISGHVMVRNYGMAKVFTLSQRVPLSAMLSYSNDLIMVLDKDMRVVEINDQFLTFLGCSRTDVLGKNSAFLSSPSVDLDEIRKSIELKRNKATFQITIPSDDSHNLTFRGKNVATVFDDGSQGATIILEDITEQVLAEEALKASEERFRLMAEHIQDALVIIENNKTIYTNNRLVEITGYSLKELERMGPNGLIAKESQKEIEDFINYLEVGNETSGEVRIWIQCKDKSRKYMYGRLTSHNQEGRQFFYLILTDLTKEKEAENILRESEQRFRLMAENLREGILILENEKIVFANRGIIDITGYSFEEIHNLDIPSVISQPDQAHFEEIARKVDNGEIPSAEVNFWITRKDGMRRYISGRVTASRIGDVRSIYVTASDITSTITKENSQQTQIRCLQRVIDILPHAIFTRDISGKILTVNSRFGEIIGMNPEDLLGKSLRDILSPDLYTILSEGDEKIIAQSTDHFRYEGVVPNAKGVPVPAIIRKELFLNCEGKVGGIMVGIYLNQDGEASDFPMSDSSQDQIPMAGLGKNGKSLKKPTFRKNSRV